MAGTKGKNTKPANQYIKSAEQNGVQILVMSIDKMGIFNERKKCSWDSSM